MKLLIVDDEKIIRETISQHIPWHQYGIDVVQTASNGLEAYDIILDESPDIVMTDIKMPGLTGLELLKKVRQINDETPFIILSGYGEFDFAREAMHYGVQHYLLKPCNEEQIIQSVTEALDELSQKRAYKELSAAAASAQQTESTAILNILNECIAQEPSDNPDYSEVLGPYHKFMDFDNAAYELCYLYFVDQSSLDEVVAYISNFKRQHFPGIPMTIVYVHQTLVLFFPSFRLRYDAFDTHMKELRLTSQHTQPEYLREHKNSLRDTIYEVVKRIRRYDTIYFVQQDTIVTICNYPSIIRSVETLTLEMYQSDREAAQTAFDALRQTISTVTDPVFLKQLISSVVMLSASKCLSFSSYEAAAFLVEINALTGTDAIVTAVIEKLQAIFDKYHSTRAATSTISTTIDGYVRANLSEPDLSLKWIAENCLYMNVDYVSKKFLKETGTRFSTYLTNVRIQKAKELLLREGIDRVQDVAEMVGCGNNPQYFSQLFKKSTGMTPSAFIKHNGTE